MCCVALFFSPRHTSFIPFPVSPLRLFPISSSFYVKLSATLNNNNNNNEGGDESDDANDDDRPANGVKGKDTRGTQKALKILLYFAVDSIRSLARVRVINRRIPSRHFTFFFFRFSHLRCCIFRSIALEIKIPRLRITTNASRRRIAADNILEKQKTERKEPPRIATIRKELYTT